MARERKTGELIWQKSQGMLHAFRKYINAHKSQYYAPSDLDNLLQQAKHQRVMIITDVAGMGKSTVLTNLSESIREKFQPTGW